jgi:soluble lytic murein transglycosylase-like protein
MMGLKKIQFFKKGSKLEIAEEEFKYTPSQDNLLDVIYQKTSEFMKAPLDEYILSEGEKMDKLQDEWDSLVVPETIINNKTNLIGTSLQGNIDLSTEYNEKDINALYKVKTTYDYYGSDKKVKALSDKYNVDNSLTLAIIAQESEGNPLVVNSIGATGLMQIYGKGKDKYEKMFFEKANHGKTWDKEKDGYKYLLDPYNNIEAGLKIFNYSKDVLRKSYKNELEDGSMTNDDISWLAIRGYNSGPGYFTKNNTKKLSPKSIKQNTGHLKGIYNYYQYLKNNNL